MVLLETVPIYSLIYGLLETVPIYSLIYGFIGNCTYLFTYLWFYWKLYLFIHLFMVYWKLYLFIHLFMVLLETVPIYSPYDQTSSVVLTESICRRQGDICFLFRISSKMLIIHPNYPSNNTTLLLSYKQR